MEQEKDHSLPVSIVLSAIIVSAALIYYANAGKNGASSNQAGKTAERAGADANASAIEEQVTPKGGVALPVTWGNLGVQMVQDGVIDEARFKQLYAERGGLPSDMNAMLTASDNGKIVINPQNSGMVLNLLWALGLGNKSQILENGPMQDLQYGGAGKFASTGGWTLAKGSTMNHYSAHALVPLTAEQEQLVERVAKNIYRPCCGNSTYFPDCNHGMAMLGLLELMASQGVAESQMYAAALAVNSYWFPGTYLTIAQYLKDQGTDWKSVSPQEMLGAQYSSAQGYQQFLKKTQPVQTKPAGGCGV